MVEEKSRRVIQRERERYREREVKLPDLIGQIDNRGVIDDFIA